MELFEIATKNKALRMLHKILLISGVLTLVYLLIKAYEEYVNQKKTPGC